MRTACLIALIAIGMAGGIVHPMYAAGPLDDRQCSGGTPDQILTACTNIISDSSYSQQNRARAYNNRGNAYRDKGNPERAIIDLTEAIKLDPHYAIAYSNRGNAYYNKGDYDRAIQDHNEAIKLAPKDGDFYVNLGVTYVRK